MHRKSKPFDTNRAVLAFCVLSLTVGLGLLSAGPVYGRWEIPQTVEPVEETHSSPGKMVISTPTPTPVVLPDQAQVPILMYHYVSELPPNPDRYRLDLTVLPENF
ncbi:MAG: hypothetical protein KAX24_10795, partial [Anaerolineae bacterium]|nr:hypothetical protein [Anaerolineae bacterium]